MKWLLAKAGKLYVMYCYDNLTDCFKNKSNLVNQRSKWFIKKTIY